MVGIGMETGGNNPVYIREDVDIDAILPQIIKGTFQNSGQDLDSVGRIYVDQSRYNEFIEKSAEQIQQFKLGDPMNENTTLGPIALEQNLFELEKKVAAAVDNDARVILGGMITQDDQGKGQFFEPTLIVDCDNSMEIFQSINFGPIMALQQVQNDDEAISLMNDSMYGLSASVFTKNIELAQNVTKNLDYGIVNMNKCGQVNPHLVVSGRKNSGMGVQLGQMGFQNFLKPKSYNFKY